MNNIEPLTNETEGGQMTNRRRARKIHEEVGKRDEHGGQPNGQTRKTNGKQGKVRKMQENP